MSYRVTKRELSPSRSQPSLQQDRLQAIDSQESSIKVPPTADIFASNTLAATENKRPLSESDRSAKRRRLSPEIKPLETDKTEYIHHPRPRPIKAAFLNQFEDPSESSLDESVSRWLESLHSDRQKASRSDSIFEQRNRHHPDLIRPKSVSEIDNRRDKDGFAIPNTPLSAAPRVRSGQSASDVWGARSAYFQPSASSARSLVESPGYRIENLRPNHIHRIPAFKKEFPEPILELVNDIQRDRNSPEPSAKDIETDPNLFYMWDGRDGESKVENFLSGRIFPDSGGVLEQSSRLPMPRTAVPHSTSPAATTRVSNPAPDKLYGYHRDNAFTNPSQAIRLDAMGSSVIGVSQTFDMVFPFFVVEFKADGGSMWVATNQCLGGSAACVNIAERLNSLLRNCKSDTVKQVNSAAFSVAVSNETARLYISWKHDELEYYTNSVRSYLLSDPQHYLSFRKHVRNIIDWGKDRRLKEIQTAIDTLVEEERKASSALAKARPPPHAGSDASSAPSGSSKNTR